MSFKNFTHLQQRITISLFCVAILLIAIFLSPYPYFRFLFIILASATMSTAVWELYRICKAKGYLPLDTVGIAGTVAYACAVFLITQFPTLSFLPEMIMGLIIIASFIWFFIRGSEPIINLSLTFFAFLYLTIPLSYLIKINYFFPVESTQDGRWWLVYLLAVTKMTDTGAFFLGKHGSHKLAPYISPKKTWLGAFGGLAVGALTGFIFPIIISFLFSPSPLEITLCQSIWLAIFLSIAAQFGDLAESLLKRDGRVKDSNTLPGLGGVLDIVDSLVFTAPLLYIYLKIAF